MMSIREIDATSSDKTQRRGDYGVDARLEFKMAAKGGLVRAHVFIEAAKTLLSLLRDIEEVMSGSRFHQVDWVVSDLHCSSPTMAIDAVVVERPTFDVSAIPMNLVIGLHSLGIESQRPPFFSNEAVRRANRLGRIAARDSGEMEVRSGAMRVQISPAITRNARALLDPSWWEFGTIEGVLKMVSIAGTPRFNVYDSVTGVAVPCTFEEHQLEMVGPAIGRRVSVSGNVVYTNDGYPKRISEIESFYVFPPDDELPTVLDVLKTGVDLSGGLSIEEFLERRGDEYH